MGLIGWKEGFSVLGWAVGGRYGGATAMNWRNFGPGLCDDGMGYVPYMYLGTVGTICLPRYSTVP